MLLVLKIENNRFYFDGSFIGGSQNLLEMQLTTEDKPSKFFKNVRYCLMG